MLDASKIKTVFFDIDGVLIHGSKPYPGAAGILKRITRSDRNYFLLTNFSARARGTIASKLKRMGLPVTKKHVLSSSFLLAQYLKESQERGNVPQLRGRPHIFVCGGQGIITEIRHAGLRCTISRKEPTNASVVIAGIDKSLTYRKIAHAQKALMAGALFVVTNLDPTLPVEGGYLPGAGVTVAAIEMASGVSPVMIAGKPAKSAMLTALNVARCKPHEAVMIGDRLDTDIAVARNVNMPSILVLSGAHQRKHVTKGNGPTLILKDLIDVGKFLKV